VFLSSQLTSRVLVRRLPQRVVMLSGITLSGVGLLLATQLQVSTSYFQILPWLVLIGSGAGMSFVSLTSASLSEVEPQDAGAASGLINVSQQLGAAVGLAVLVTVFGAASGHIQLDGRRPSLSTAAFVHLQALELKGLHDVFALGVIFTLSALVMVACGVRRAVAPAPTPTSSSVATRDESREDDENDPSWLAETA